MDKSKVILQRDYSVDLPYIDSKIRANASKLWVPFDRDNLFPNRLYNMYKESPLQSSIIDNQIKYTYGAGLKEYSASIFTPNLGERWEDFIKKCITDFAIYGSFALQLILNDEGNRFLYYHVPVNQVRLGAYNDENIIDRAYLATDWSRISSNSVIEIKMFGCEQPKKGERYLMYCKPYDPDELFYAVPKWYSAANWVLADIALSKYFLNYIKNAFSANLAIRYPCDIDEEKKQELYELLVRSFGGEENAQALLEFLRDPVTDEMTIHLLAFENENLHASAEGSLSFSLTDDQIREQLNKVVHDNDYRPMIIQSGDIAQLLKQEDEDA